MNRAIPLIIALVIFIPLLIIELPVFLPLIPRWLLKGLCFAPIGALIYIGLHGLSEHNTNAFVIALFGSLFCLYVGFTLKSMIE